MSLIEVVEVCKSEFPDWNWLVRSDRECGAFANLSKSGLVFLEEWIDGVTCFPSWAETPEAALLGSLEQARKAKARLAA